MDNIILRMKQGLINEKEIKDFHVHKYPEPYDYSLTS